MLEELKQLVFEANLELPRQGLVKYTWGNVSAIDRNQGLVVIKPSGVDYTSMRPEDMVVVDLEGRVVQGNLRPSSDTPTHIELYKAFPNIGGVCHTHSTYAAAYAQAGRHIPLYGTTHADYFSGNIPCTRALTTAEIEEDYEGKTGSLIIETFQDKDLNYEYIPGVLCRNHGPFTWGKTADEAVYHAVVLEEVAKMAILTKEINPQVPPAPMNIVKKHFERKHGPDAYYGQKKTTTPYEIS